MRLLFPESEGSGTTTVSEALKELDYGITGDIVRWVFAAPVALFSCLAVVFVTGGLLGSSPFFYVLPAAAWIICGTLAVPNHQTIGSIALFFLGAFTSWKLGGMERLWLSASEVQMFSIGLFSGGMAVVLCIRWLGRLRIGLALACGAAVVVLAFGVAVAHAYWVAPIGRFGFVHTRQPDNEWRQSDVSWVRTAGFGSRSPLFIWTKDSTAVWLRELRVQPDIRIETDIGSGTESVRAFVVQDAAERKTVEAAIVRFYSGWPKGFLPTPSSSLEGAVLIRLERR